MERARIWAGRQWPVVGVLAVLLCGDVVSVRGLGVNGLWWVWPGALALCGVALVAPRWPVGAGLSAAVLLAGWSAVLRLVGAQVVPSLGTLLAVETGAVAVLIVVAVRRRSAFVAGGVVCWLLMGCAAAQWLRLEPSAGAPLRDRVVPGALVLCLCVTAGRYLRRRDVERARATADAVAAAQQRERLGLARELHDVVAHHVGVMVVQAQAARVAAAVRPDAAAAVLPVIEALGTDALAAMRRLVVALRDSDPDGVPLVRTTDLVADLESVTALPRGGGTPVRLDVDLAEPVPAEVTTTVVRLVQESVTNARRHAAGARRIDASVRTGDGVVRVRVRDDGRAAAVSSMRGGGYGLIGMRERVQLLGGRFTAGREPGGGWQISAEMPLRESGR